MRLVLVSTPDTTRCDDEIIPSLMEGSVAESVPHLPVNGPMALHPSPRTPSTAPEISIETAESGVTFVLHRFLEDLLLPPRHASLTPGPSVDRLRWPISYYYGSGHLLAQRHRTSGTAVEDGDSDAFIKLAGDSDYPPILSPVSAVAHLSHLLLRLPVSYHLVPVLLNFSPDDFRRSRDYPKNSVC